MRINKEYDVIVVGGGHAGCEAALASARTGAETLILNLYLDSIALMPCNPSIGGPAKGHLVREIDALGGEMAKAADYATHHLRWLNTSKGPAVRTLRAQCDPRRYSDWYRKALMNCENLDIYQTQVTDIVIEDGKVRGVVITTGQTIRGKSVILATGTYLASKIHIGLTCHKSGPLGMVAATKLGRSLKKTGIRIGRLRTDTPPRILADTVNWEILDKQESISEPQAFSYFGEKKVHEGIICGLTRTNHQTHEIMRTYYNQSPLVQGNIETSGPRYCPSIDDKVIKFPEKDSHPIFLEPINNSSNEVYMQNFSTSMCMEAQFETVHTIKGCENAEIVRPGYAIEYDFIDPTQLELWLELKDIKNLFTAGQINGTSGYEEAGAQGILAGINASRKVQGKEPIILGRHESYLGVLIDDLVTKGTLEPYRMLTSRCEYRLLLRHDNADKRLAAKGYEVGLLTAKQYSLLENNWNKMEEEKELLKRTKVSPSKETATILKNAGSSVIKEGTAAYELLRRPEIDWKTIKKLINHDIEDELGERIAIEIKYSGYIERQMKQVDKFRRMEKLKFPESFDFSSVTGLSAEGKQKLIKIRPRTLGQASRISGVPPTDIQLIWVTMENSRRLRKK